MTEERDERKISSWGDLFVKTIELGLGAAALTAETAQKLVNDLVSRGQVTREEGSNLLDRLLTLGHEQREQIKEMVDKATERAMDRMDLARKSDVDELRKRLDILEHIVQSHVGAAPPTPGMTPEMFIENQ